MNSESKQIWIGRPHLVLGKDVARAVADVGLNGHKELWFEGHCRQKGRSCHGKGGCLCPDASQAGTSHRSPHLQRRTELAMEGLGVLDRFDKAFPLETIRKNHDELEAKARLGSRNQHYMEAVKAMDEKGIHASESVLRKMRGGAAAEAVIKANREKLLGKAKETGLL